MTPSEFKAWFDGFTEAFTGVPTKAQWARVKERVAEIDGKPVTERVFVDRYWPQFVPYYRHYGLYGVSTPTYCGNRVINAVGQNTTAYSAGATTTEWKASSNTSSFNSSDAMLALGRADAQALAA